MTHHYAKDKHYHAQLLCALNSGSWTSSQPGKTPSAAPISWSELLRKFTKHTHSAPFASLASQTQALALLLGAGSKDSDVALNERRRYDVLALGEESTLKEERMDEAKEGYETLKKLDAEASLDSIKLALAYYAYALHDPSQCLSYLSSVDLDSVWHQPTTNGSSKHEADSVHLHRSTIQIDAVTDDKYTQAWAMTQALRSFCLKGMAYEKLGSQTAAHDTYLSALPLISAVLTSVVPSTLHATPSRATTPTHAPSYTGALASAFGAEFAQLREMWRWVERLLWRAVVLAAQRVASTSGAGLPVPSKRESSGHSGLPSTVNAVAGDSDEEQLWTLLDTYRACAAHWSADFRSEHRATVYTIHLRLLILWLRAHPQASTGTLSQTPQPDTSAKQNGIESETTHPSLQPPARTLALGRALATEYRAVLSASTSFPSAGKRNVKVEEFVDLCVALWEASGGRGSGGRAGWVSDILWWATRLTFNCPRIYRHMARVFPAAGDAPLAARALRLYVQVVGKAHETAVAGGERSPKRPQHPEEAARLEAEQEQRGEETDRRWIETLVLGARMLCRLGGKDRIREAGEVLSKARARLDEEAGAGEERELVACLELAEGVRALLMAHSEHDPRTRPDHLSHAYRALSRSLDSHPMPGAHYHLALLLSHPGPTRSLSDALEAAQAAVEGAPREVRAWHILALLLAADEQWAAARGVLEHAIVIADEHDTGNADLKGGQVAQDVPLVNGGPQHHASPGDLHLLLGSREGDERAGMTIPRASTLLHSHLAAIAPPPSEGEAFAHALQLRMTLVALCERVDGAERAEGRWLDVFAWIAERKGVAGERARSSMEASRPPTIMTQATSDATHKDESARRHSLSADPPGDAQPASSTLGLPGITITPATPGEEKEVSETSLGAAPSVETTTEQYERSFDKERPNHGEKRGASVSVMDGRDGHREKGPGKKVQRMLKHRVNQGQARINTISKKMGKGVSRSGSFGSLSLRRVNSAPDIDFHSELPHSQYQASSIHSRNRFSSIIRNPRDSLAPMPESPPPPPAPSITPTTEAVGRRRKREAEEDRLLSDLWLMSAATFRRLGKIEQAKGSIQEAEVKDESNPGVWVQLGLYYMAHGRTQAATDALHKALFINADDVSATIHLCRMHLSPHPSSSLEDLDPENIDLAAGMLDHLTRGPGWDVPEAWYFLARAYSAQGRREREKECLAYALVLSEGRSVRDIGAAVGWCL